MTKLCKRQYEKGSFLFHVQSKFCSMKITQEVREFAKTKDVNLDRALEVGMREKAIGSSNQV